MDYTYDSTNEGKTFLVSLVLPLPYGILLLVGTVAMMATASIGLHQKIVTVHCLWDLTTIAMLICLSKLVVTAALQFVVPNSDS